MNKLLRGAKLLLFLLFISTVFSAIFIMPYILYQNSGREVYLSVYVMHFFVVSYLLGKDVD